MNLILEFYRYLLINGFGNDPRKKKQKLHLDIITCYPKNLDYMILKQQSSFDNVPI